MDENEKQISDHPITDKQRELRLASQGEAPVMDERATQAFVMPEIMDDQKTESHPPPAIMLPLQLLPANKGIMGRFLQREKNVSKAKGKQMDELLRGIHEDQEEMHDLLVTAKERSAASKAALKARLIEQGLIEEDD